MIAKTIDQIAFHTNQIMEKARILSDTNCNIITHVDYMKSIVIKNLNFFSLGISIRAHPVIAIN